MYNTVNVKDIRNVDLFETGSTISLQVLSSDDNLYHVKLPHSTHNNNLHEYLAHIIAEQIDAPIPNGSFIQFSKDHYEEIKADIQNEIDFIEKTKGFRPNALDKYLDFLNMVLKTEDDDDLILFGIVFIEGAQDDLTKEEFNLLIDEVKNLDEFYSLYAYDFYIDNRDRHIGNILIVPGLRVAYLIDHDKIFAQKNIRSTSANVIDKTLFDCPKNDANKYLYEFINDEEQYIKVMSYAKKINSCNNDIIKKELDCNYYNLDHDSLELIKNYFLYRKNHLVEECNKFKDRCYENIN